jgi:hypothetical protein
MFLGRASRIPELYQTLAMALTRLIGAGIRKGTGVSQTFEIGVAEKIGYYVYLLIDPRTSEVFYVGKGVGDRCFAHVQVARRTKAGVIGDYPKLDRIREIEAAGQEVRLDILRHGLEEETAFHVEAATIDALRLDARDMGLLTNVVAGRDAEQGRQSVADINALYTAPPVEIAPEHKAVLIRINNEWFRGISPERLYAVTRASWVIGANRRALGGPRAPDYAFGVYRGVVRAVYKIEAWTADPRPLQPGKPARWVFTGHPDTGLASDYLGRDVSG